MSLEVVEQLSNLIGKEPDFDQYRETDEYKKYFELIKIENENMSEYLINMAIFGFWYTENKGDIPERETEIPKPVKGDVPDLINVYNSFEDYLIENPNVKVLGEDIKIIEN